MNIRRVLSILSVLFTVAIAASLAGLFWLAPQIQQFYEQPLQSDDDFYLVPAGSHIGRVARDFQQRGWIEDAEVLRYWYRIKGQASQLHAGEFALADSDTVDSLLQRIVRGDVIQHPLTVVEGQRFSDFRAALAAAPGLQQKTQAWSDAEIMSALGAEGQHPEGQFFPDTYFYTRDATDLSLLKQAYTRLQNTLQQEWQNKAEGLPYKTAYEALIMASIIEKETGIASERAEIAGVFVRRLQKGMKLQTDPTIIYGMGDRYKGNIRRRDILEATPYNTYVIKALPPTPIALPGAAAIHATLHPADGDALYFVATGDGGHYFSATLEEHNRAVRKYQLKR
jgi:UPF0755 protein